MLTAALRPGGLLIDVSWLAEKPLPHVPHRQHDSLRHVLIFVSQPGDAAGLHPAVLLPGPPEDLPDGYPHDVSRLGVDALYRIPSLAPALSYVLYLGLTIGIIGEEEADGRLTLERGEPDIVEGLEFGVQGGQHDQGHAELPSE